MSIRTLLLILAVASFGSCILQAKGIVSEDQIIRRALGGRFSSEQQSLISEIIEKINKKYPVHINPDGQKTVKKKLLSVVKILGVSIAASILYGWAHDMVTSHICVEYFTVGHRRMHSSNNPAIHALIWGVLATWWVGAGLGTGLALASQLGDGDTTIEISEIKKELGILLGLMGVGSLCAGSIGYVSARQGIQRLPEFFKAYWDGEKENGARERTEGLENRFLADGAAHNTAYAIGAVGGLSLIGYVLWKRVQKSKMLKKRFMAFVQLGACSSSNELENLNRRLNMD